MNGKYLFLIGVIVFLLLGGLLYWISRPGSTSGSGETLTLYCAAGIKKPVQELVDRFEDETGRPRAVAVRGLGDAAEQS